MANSTAVTGLLADLGLGPINEGAAAQAAQQSKNSQQSGRFGAAFSAGQAMGRPGAAGMAGLLGGIKGLIKPQEGEGRGFKQFIQNTREAGVAARDNEIAQGLGISPQKLQQTRAIQKEVANIQVPETGDAFADQQSALKQIIEMANRNGDMDLAVKAKAKQNQLKKQEQELKKVEGGNKADAAKLGDDTRSYAERRATGIPVIPNGADSKADDFTPSHAFWDEATDTYTIVHPDGTEEKGVDKFVAFNEFSGAVKTGSKGGRLRVSDKIANEAIQQMGGNKAFSAARTAMDDIIKVADATGNISDVFTSFDDPQAVVGLAGDITLKVDNGIRLLESTASAFDGSGSGTGTYTDKVSGKQIPDDQYMMNGKPVSKQKQKEIFMAVSDDVFDSAMNFFPAETRAVIAERGLEASKLKSMIMELAYLDARQQEPSNRGLSDKDIEAALQRIGAYAANPVSFIDVQLQKAERTLKELGRLGDGIAKTENHTAQELREHIWVPAKKAQVVGIVEANIEKLVKARQDIIAKQTNTVSPNAQEAPAGGGMTLEQKKARLAELEGN